MRAERVLGDAVARVGDHEHLADARDLDADVFNRPIQPLVSVADAEGHRALQLVIETERELLGPDRLEIRIDQVVVGIVGHVAPIGLFDERAGQPDPGVPSQLIDGQS